MTLNLAAMGQQWFTNQLSASRDTIVTANTTLHAEEMSDLREFTAPSGMAGNDGIHSHGTLRLGAGL